MSNISPEGAVKVAVTVDDFVLWDGVQLIDAGAGFAGNDDLARDLLGFTPTRHAPQGSSPDMLVLPDAPIDEQDETEAMEPDE